jgi:hypothetical protein
MLFSEGFLVMPGLVDGPICHDAAKAIRGRVSRTLAQMQLSSSKHFKAMLTADWMHSPLGWSGPPWNSIGLRGWQLGPGTGRSRAPSSPEIENNLGMNHLSFWIPDRDYVFAYCDFNSGEGPIATASPGHWGPLGEAVIQQPSGKPALRQPQIYQDFKSTNQILGW